MHFLLVHSPFLGPSIWLPLRTILIERGHEVVVPDIRVGLGDNSNTYDAMARLIAADGQAETHVIMHSGAGALAPSIWATDQRLRSMVFLDALLPHPGQSWLETLPTIMADRLRAAAANGLLPSWPNWLPAGALEQLIPDNAFRCLISGEASRVPLSYVTAKAPRIVGWEQSSVGRYIQLSDGYDREAHEASKLGLAVDRYPGNHLSMASSPSSVADLIINSLS